MCVCVLSGNSAFRSECMCDVCVMCAYMEQSSTHIKALQEQLDFEILRLHFFFGGGGGQSQIALSKLTGRIQSSLRFIMDCWYAQGTTNEHDEHVAMAFIWWQNDNKHPVFIDRAPLQHTQSYTHIHTHSPTQLIAIERTTPT